MQVRDDDKIASETAEMGNALELMSTLLERLKRTDRDSANCLSLLNDIHANALRLIRHTKALSAYCGPTDEENEDDEVEKIANKIDLSALAEAISMEKLAGAIDISDLIDELPMNDIASEIDASDIVEHIDFSTLASEMDMDEVANRVDLDDLSKCISIRDLAREIDYVELANSLPSSLTKRIAEQVAESIDIQTILDRLTEESDARSRIVDAVVASIKARL